MTQGLTDMAREYLARKVADPELRAKLTPSYPVGCKRPLQSRAWFPTFSRPNVTLETTPIVEFTERGLRTADGVEHEFDTVIYGTGFHAADYLLSLDVYGRSGRRLRDDWRDGAEAYLGTVVPGYPNLFTLYGPNTNGVTSIIYILEAQAEFVRRMLDDMGRRRLQAWTSGARSTTATTPRSSGRWTAPSGWRTATATTGTPTARWSPNFP